MTDSTSADARLRAQLDSVAAYEASIRPGPVTALFRKLGRTAAFGRVYRVVGPKVDPHVAKIKDGAVLAKIYGFRALTLHTVGNKSGQPRVSPLLYIRDGDDVVLIGTNFGQPKHPGWTANLLAQPEAEVGIGPERLKVTAELADEETWARLFPAFVEMYPGYQDYIGRRQGLTPRMFLLHPHA
jgi:deazaflavin-dependent oxidoreductase (nitroreductase family)